MKYYFFNAKFSGGTASGVYDFSEDLNPIQVVELIKERIALRSNVLRTSIEFTQFHRVD